MRGVGLLAGLGVAGAAAIGTSVVGAGTKPAVVTAGAGLLGVGVVGLAVAGLDAAAEGRHRPKAASRGPLVSTADRIAVLLGSGAVFVRVGLVHVVADPLRAGGAALMIAAVSTIGVAVGYRTDGFADGLRHGLLACGLGGALCVTLTAYDASRIATSGTFDAVVAGSGLVLPVTFGLFGGVSGVAGWWLAERFAGIDPLR
ncbi:hypothetical protein BRC82_02255 [Halobacteriales archaeon QS_1_67_19]|nr:MAG: hypothetical protein BRC82_02255 [Halobacteriales archaeon QS_1_67_19]